MTRRASTSLPPLTALALAGLVLVGCGAEPTTVPGSAPAPGEPPSRVFFITVDTLRADYLGTYGYPRDTSPVLDRLAAGGVLYERAVAQWPKTGTSFASIFTGRYPQSTGLTHKAAIEIPERWTILPEVFRDAGYVTAGVVSNAVLGANFGWGRGFDEFLQSWGAGEFPDDPESFRRYLWAGRVNEVALPLLERLAAEEKSFLWLHYSDPHAPYILQAESPNPFLDDVLFRDQAAEGIEVPRFFKGRTVGERRDLAWYKAQYAANVRVVDRAIGEVLDRAEALGLLDDAWIVFTADHGESLGEHGSWFEHGPLPYNASSHVPLFFTAHGRSASTIEGGRRLTEPVELIDLFPTLRDLVAPGLELPQLEGVSRLAELGGRPAAESGPEAPPAVAFSEAGYRPEHYRSVQEAGWKLIFHPEIERRGEVETPARVELYDLASDPGETLDLSADRPAELARLRRRLIGWMRTADGTATEGEEPVDEETLRALRALGYVN